MGLFDFDFGGIGGGLGGMQPPMGGVGQMPKPLSGGPSAGSGQAQGPGQGAQQQPPQIPNVAGQQKPMGGQQGQKQQGPPQIPNAAGPSTVGSGTAQTGMKQPMMSDLSQSRQQGGRLSFMDTLAQIESSGGTQVRNLISPKHVGKYQMSQEAFKRFSNGGDINDEKAQESAARAYTDYNRSSLKQIFGRDPTDAEVYLSYNQGLAGAHRLISNPNVPAGQLVKPQNIVNQGGDPAAPAGQFMKMISAKWNDLSQGSGSPSTGSGGGF